MGRIQAARVVEGKARIVVSSGFRASAAALMGADVPRASVAFSPRALYNGRVGEFFILKKNGSAFCRAALCGLGASLKIAAALALCLALASCKKKERLELDEYTPLSKKAADLSAGADWAFEIESGRLDKKIGSFDLISRSVPLSPLSVAVLTGAAPMALVYPELEGFGSLDTSNIQGELLDTARLFCSALLEYSRAQDEYEKYAAQKALEDAQKTQADDGGEQEDAPKKDSSKIDSFFSSRSLFSLAFFLSDSKSAGVLQSFIIGKPFVGEDLIEIPVRWTGQKEILYTRLYPVQAQDGWKIQQIEIYKSEANDGSAKAYGN